MRSKTIKDEAGDHVSVRRLGKHFSAEVRIKMYEIGTGRLISESWVWLRPEKLRAFGQACIQIADEIDAAKAKEKK